MTGVFGKKEPETGIGIKDAGSTEMITQDEYNRRVKEIARIRKDPVWWAENYFKIVTLDKGLVTIQLYQKQRDLLNFIRNNTRIVTLASRQCGKCEFIESKITVRNKKTGKVKEISIKDLINDII